MSNYLGATQESIEKTLASVKDETQLSKAIDTGTGLEGNNLEQPKFVGR